MNFIIDENLPPALARALQELFLKEHTIAHMRDKFGPGVADADWIRTLNGEGRWIVISGDRRITRNKSEYNAFRASKLIGFFLSAKLYKAKLSKKAERILALWDSLLEISNRIEGGAMFELQISGTKISQLKS